MKTVTASEARRNWFRLLDEVAEGEVVVLERKGRRIVLRREDASPPGRSATPDYRSLLSVPDLDEADRWGWEYQGPGEDLRSRDREEPSR